jgi:hypothetical protein
MSKTFLYCLKGNLSEIDMAACLENLFNSAMTDIHEIEKLKNDLNLFLKNTKNDAESIQQEILNFKNKFNILHELAFENFINVMKTACSSPYLSNLTPPITTETLQQMTGVINNDRLPAELKEKLLKKYMICKKMYLDITEIINHTNTTPQITSEANDQTSTHNTKIKL